MAILKNIIPAIAASLLTAGCYEDFDPCIDTKPVLCLNSLITAGEPIEVEVSHTWMFNDPKSESDHTVDDATVTITANGSIVPGGYIPREGDRIRIAAESPTYGAASAEVTVPYAVRPGKITASPSVTDLWISPHAFAPNTYGTAAMVRFNLGIEMDIDDPAGTDNYYEFGYRWFDTLDEYDRWTTDRCRLWIGSLEYDAEPIFREHIDVFETVMGNSEDTDFMLFTDRQFQGNRYTMHLNFESNRFNMDSHGGYDSSLMECGVILCLTAVSQSYYSWEVYRWYTDEGITGDLADIGLAESKWGYSNVSTGAGVVAARTRSEVTVSLKEFLQSVIPPPDPPAGLPDFTVR